MEQKNLLNTFYPQDAGTINLPHKEMALSDYKFFYKINDQVKAQISEKNYYQVFGDEVQPNNSDLWQLGNIVAVSRGDLVVEFVDLVKSTIDLIEDSFDKNKEGLDITNNNRVILNSSKFCERYPLNSSKVRVLTKTINGDGRISNLLESKKKSKAAQKRKNSEKVSLAKNKRNQLLQETISMLEEQIVIIDTKQIKNDSSEKAIKYCFSEHDPKSHQHLPIYFAKDPVDSVKNILEKTNSHTEKIDSHFEIKIPKSNRKAKIDKKNQKSTAITQLLLSSHVTEYIQDDIDYSYNRNDTTSSDLWDFKSGLYESTNTLNRKFLKDADDKSCKSQKFNTLISQEFDSKPISENRFNNKDLFIYQSGQQDRCALCKEKEQYGDLDSDEELMNIINPMYNSSYELGLFATEFPFILNPKKTPAIKKLQEKNGTTYDPGNGGSSENFKKYWVHDCCARFSPRVLIDESLNSETIWYNVSSEIIRGRNLDAQEIENSDSITFNYGVSSDIAKPTDDKVFGSIIETNQQALTDSNSLNTSVIEWSQAKLDIKTDIGPIGIGSYVGDIEDYSHTPYFTRDNCLTSIKPSYSSLGEKKMKNSLDNRHSFLSPIPPISNLSSYGPTRSTLWSLPVYSTYFNISGRAPRWATHSGTDYHGTWLPQTVRRSLLRFTKQEELVLSNFLGRGTDVIESFLLKRKCVGIDINHTAITLSKYNSSFVSYKNFLTMNNSEENEFSLDEFTRIKPVIFNGDSRNLGAISGPDSKKYFFTQNSVNDDEYVGGTFDYILSHPPYKDCVSYSSNISGDLSRFPDSVEFQNEMKLVVGETYRLLKKNRFVTLGIGDNRFQCFYTTVGFQLIRNYINNGFDIIELIIKKQKNCQMYGLGTRLCTQFDFLLFTHELCKLNEADYIAIDKDSLREYSIGMGFNYRTQRQMVKSLPTDPRKVVMGTVWTFKLNYLAEFNNNFSFSDLCVAKIVKRFGLSFSYWELLTLEPNLKKYNFTENLNLGHKNMSISLSTHMNGYHDFKMDNFPVSSTMNECEKDIVPIKHNIKKRKVDFRRSTDTYEQKRQRQIQKNREMLTSLGLITELGEKSNDLPYLTSLGLTKSKTSSRSNLTNDRKLDNNEDSRGENSDIISDCSYFSGSGESSDYNSESDSEIELSDDESQSDKETKKSNDIDKKISNEDSTPLSLIVIPHIEGKDLFGNYKSWACKCLDNECGLNCGCQGSSPKNVIKNYRRMIVQLLLNNYKRLMNSGQIVIGVQDIRDPINGELWPMGMLVCEDIENSVSNTVLRLKELVVVVPEGYKNTKDLQYYKENNINISRNNSEEPNVRYVVDLPNKKIDHLPIVHAYYLVYMKLQ
ncbi:hypothetical protein AYI69_g919 [Smittium culicis]|uniref:DNA methylase N-4/N-6 domain-containing protein n=1 Tax=Smittium culicis TaxID=133412 RepID=A0A1R1YRV1_9FUNG|nr:hypothetical protein AYI69_g919 [Smittium culicis]